MLFSKFCVYSSLLSPFFRVRYFPSWRDKNSGTVFGKTPVRLGTGKKSEVFYQSFILSLSIIHQANIKNVLYSLFVGSSRPKLESPPQCLVQIVTSRSLALWLGSFPLHKICWRYNNCISITFIQLQELFRRLQIVVSARSMLMCWVIYLSYSKMKKHYLC